MFRPDLGEEVVCVSGDEAGALDKSLRRSSHDKRHCEHHVWQPFHCECDDKIADLPVWVVLRIGVRERQCERGQQHHAAEKDAAQYLNFCQFYRKM